MDAPGEASLYPLFLKLDSRTVLVVGAGTVGQRKILSLLAARARVRVVAPDATPTVQRLASEGAVEWRARPFEDLDLDGAFLVVAATRDAAVQRSVAAAAEAARTFVVAVDDPGHASAYSGAVVERPPFTVAISSSGAAPALTRLLREIIEQLLPGEAWVEHATRLRARWLSEGTAVTDRFAALVREFKQRAGAD